MFPRGLLQLKTRNSHKSFAKIMWIQSGIHNVYAFSICILAELNELKGITSLIYRYGRFFHSNSGTLLCNQVKLVFLISEKWHSKIQKVALFFCSTQRKRGGSLRTRLVLWAHKEKYYQREERGGQGGDERETLKELECFVPAQLASNTFNNETGNKTHWHTQPHTHTQDVFSHSYVLLKAFVALKQIAYVMFWTIINKIL